MSNKKEKPNDTKYLDMILMISTFIDFYCETIDSDDIEDFIETYVGEFSEETQELAYETLKENIEKADKVIFLTGVLPDTEYIKLISSIPNLDEETRDENIKSDFSNVNLMQTYDLPNNEQFNVYYILNFFKFKVKNRRKTKVELEIELKDAEKNEDYEKAIKIRDKLKKMKSNKK